jgi:tetratricopeptide (TPR) repeat protein
VSARRFIGFVFLSAALHAQMLSPFAGGVTVSGEVRAGSGAQRRDFSVELYSTRSNAVIEREPVDGTRFEFRNVPPGDYAVRLVTTPDEAPVVQEFYRVDQGSGPLVLQLPEKREPRPISGTVSLRELEHPIPIKALRAASDGHRYAQSNEPEKAIAKLEQAVRIDPSFRDAHSDLGVQYAVAGRFAEAQAEFQKALAIGPPAAAIYANLALTSVAFGRRSDAEAFTRKALQADPQNSVALKLLQTLSMR